ncbi:MFS general substrate transporter [Exidia glandulosa HHB12029]|uniref:Autophagy-related protein n=1 Tax=Exidia glandulosa HHB12029 TaxID=1314781 RepID=A0A165D4C1_EXIGL|nr:MFS general substrate transporter [Exidia glandulosa HHB12029]
MVCWRKSSTAPPLSEQQLADRRHKRGWLAYAFASEAFVIVSLTLFLPVALEQYARDNGRATPELVKPCTASDVPSDAGCKVNLGGGWINTTSFSLYVNASSVALQTLVVISMGAIADRPYYRKRLLLGFAWLGALCTIIFFALPSSSKAWPLAIPLAILSNVGYGASFVSLNAYLPGIAARDPAVLAASTNDPAIVEDLVPGDIHAPSVPDEEKTVGVAPTVASEKSTNEKDESGAAAATVAPVLDTSVAPPSYSAALSRAMARTSAHGIATGYGAGIALLIISLIPVIILSGSTLALRIAIGMSGIWWAAGTVLTLLWLGTSERGDKPSVPREIVRAWVELFSMLRPSEMKKLANTFKFLAAWFLLSDGLTTITATAILFAKTTLHMPSTSLIALGALVPLAGICGTLLWPIIQRRFLHWSTKTMIVLLCSLASLLPLYGSIGIPLERKGVHGGGLTASGEMYGAAVFFGLLYGAFQSYARALFGEIIPPSEEARWFALYSITDKSSSFVGPLIVGAIADATGDIRWAFVFLFGMVLVAIPVLLSVNVRRGREDALRYQRA